MTELTEHVGVHFFNFQAWGISQAWNLKRLRFDRRLWDTVIHAVSHPGSESVSQPESGVLQDYVGKEQQTLPPVQI